MRRIAVVMASVVVVLVGVGATVQALSGAQPDQAQADPPSVTQPFVATSPPTPTAIASATAIPKPSPMPGPFAMDLYQRGDYAREYRDTWCLPAAMQTSMNIMDAGADITSATQLRLWNYARSLVPDREGGAEPEAWALGLTKLGHGGYKVSIQPSLKAAIQLAAKQVRLTNRPAGLMVWKGVHSWVMSGFTATRDPAQTDGFTVTAVRIEDVWYPRISKIWGVSNPPDTLVPVRKLPEDFLPWHLLYDGPHPDKDGKFVIVIPVD